MTLFSLFSETTFIPDEKILSASKIETFLSFIGLTIILEKMTM
jgi:hypothetical protein